jgi:hypothetical protein
MYLGARGTDAKKKLSLKVVHKTLDEFIYILEKQKNILNEFIYSARIRKKEKMTSQIFLAEQAERGFARSMMVDPPYK